MPTPPTEDTICADPPDVPASAQNQLTDALFIAQQDAAYQSCKSALGRLVAWISSVQAQISSGNTPPTPAK